MAAPSHVLPFLSPAGGCTASSARARSGRRAGLLRCSAAAGQAGFFTRLGRLIKEKAKSDVEKLFSGFSKTRENLSVVDELLTYWNLADTDRVLDDLEEALLVSDFGPKISFRIVDTLREEIRDGKLKSGAEIKAALKRCILELLTSKGGNTELNLGFRKPAVIMIVGVNGGGKTTSLGKLAYRFKNEGVKAYADRPKEEQPEWWSWSWPSRSLMEAAHGQQRSVKKSSDGVVARSSDDDGGASRHWLRPSLEIGIRVVGGETGGSGEPRTECPGPHLSFICAVRRGPSSHRWAGRPRSGRETRPKEAVGLPRSGDQSNSSNFSKQ